MPATTYAANNELDELNFGFEYDEIISVNSSELNNFTHTKQHDNLYDFKSNQKYYNMEDIIAFNTSSSGLSSSPDLQQIFSPSSLNYKIWLKQQIDMSK